MDWNSIRKQHPHMWLLIEATSAHSDDADRVLDDIEVIESFSNSKEAMDRYKDLHRGNPTREFYVVHTDREELNIKERKWVGIRAGQAA